MNFPGDIFSAWQGMKRNFNFKLDKNFSKVLSPCKLATSWGKPRGLIPKCNTLGRGRWRWNFSLNRARIQIHPWPCRPPEGPGTGMCDTCPWTHCRGSCASRWCSACSSLTPFGKKPRESFRSMRRCYSQSSLEILNVSSYCGPSDERIYHL